MIFKREIYHYDLSIDETVPLLDLVFPPPLNPNPGDGGGTG